METLTISFPFYFPHFVSPSSISPFQSSVVFVFGPWIYLSPSSSENLRFDKKKQIYDLPINQSSDDDAEPVQADGLPLLRVGHDPHLRRDGCLLGPSPLLLLAGTLITESNLQIPSFKSLSHTHATETPFLMDFSANSWCAKPPQTS